MDKTRKKKNNELQEGNEDESTLEELLIQALIFITVDCNKDILRTEDSDVCDFLSSANSKEESEDDYVELSAAYLY